MGVTFAAEASTESGTPPNKGGRLNSTISNSGFLKPARAQRFSCFPHTPTQHKTGCLWQANLSLGPSLADVHHSSDQWIGLQTRGF